MKIISYRYLPLNLYVGYSIFVLLCLFIGPIEYRNMDYLVLVPFIVSMLLLFTIGFIAGARGSFHGQGNLMESRSRTYRRISPLIRLLLLIGLVSSLMQVYVFFSSGGHVSFSSIGENYVAGYEGYERGQANVDLLYVLEILEQALSSFLILTCLYYFTVLNKFSRVAFLFVVGTYLLVNVIGSGKQKYLGDIIIFSFFCLMVNFAAKRIRFKWTIIATCVVALVVVFFMFVEILRQRYMAANINLDNIVEKAHVLIYWDTSSAVFDWISLDYGLALGIFLGYFTNGLYGLYLSLTLPFEWSYFVGNSYSIGRIVEIITGENGSILERTYPYRVGLEYGWAFDKWHSLFAWMASDISFAGILLFTPIFSFFYAKLWIQAVHATNPFSGPLFIYLSMGLIFSYANNQLMHGLAGVMVLLVLLGGWALYSWRRRSELINQQAATIGETL